MSQSGVYFGPYNDPGDLQNLHHWESDHVSDCHNPAIVVERAANAWAVNITVFLRNRPPGNGVDLETPQDLSIALYAAACGLFTKVHDVEVIVDRVLRGQNGISPIAVWENATRPRIEGYNLGLDTPWQSNPVTWSIPPYTSGILVVATVTTVDGNQSPNGAVDTLTKDPCVAVWLG